MRPGVRKHFPLDDPREIISAEQAQGRSNIMLGTLPPSFEQGIFNVYFYRTGKYLPFLTYYEIRTRNVYTGPVGDKIFVHVFDELGQGDSKLFRLSETFKMIASQQGPDRHR